MLATEYSPHSILLLTVKLLSSHPSLLYLDVYKLLYIAQSTN